MKRLRLTKVIASLLIATSVLALNPIGASAEWKQDSNGWWYSNGSSWYTGWKEINGKWYYFKQDGYMAHDTTIDEYKLGGDGAWIITQTQPQEISVVYPSNWTKITQDGKDVYILDKGTNVTFLSCSMDGRSEKEIIQSLCKEAKELSDIDINISTQIINNKTVYVLDYIQNHKGIDFKEHVGIIFNNNTVYIFIMTGADKFSDVNIKSFNTMLNTVTFAN